MRDETALPILDQLGAEFQALIAEELRSERRRLAAAARARPRQVGRLARRTAILLVMLCVVGGVALAARFGGGGPPSDSSPALLGHGAAPGWRLSGYRDRGRLCLLFTAAGEFGGGCGLSPGDDGVRATSLLVGRRRFVLGLAAPAVARVAVSAGGGRVEQATRGIGDEAVAAGVPPGARWFVVVLGVNASATSPPAFVRPLDGAGRPLGPAAVDCSLGVVGHACERAVQAGARGAGR